MIGLSHRSGETGSAVAAPRLVGFPDVGRTRIVGILNVTPDSFSDGGAFLDPAAAIEHGQRLADAGADLVDVGGESTRPGARRVTADEELGRVIPVVSALAARGIAISIDTTRAVVAREALEAGAMLVNDVSGGVGDPLMYPLIAARGVPYVVMHSRGESADMAGRAVYDDVVAQVRAELSDRVAAATAAGVGLEQIVLDPGIGFHKVGAQNWPLLAHLDVFASLGRPLLVGTSRKSFLGIALADEEGTPRPADQRDAATHATTALLALAGAWGVRVHAVAESMDAIRVATAWSAAGHR